MRNLGTINKVKKMEFNRLGKEGNNMLRESWDAQYSNGSNKILINYRILSTDMPKQLGLSITNNLLENVQ